MKAVVVGHGPSILAEPMGMLIDEFDVVIRLKRCQATLDQPDYFGTKTDIIGGSLNISGQLKGIGGAEKYWIFVDSRHTRTSPDTMAMAIQYLSGGGNEVILDKGLCDRWDAVYRELRDKTGQPGHDHTSQGMKAIIYALHYLKPDELVLVGFDNIVTGNFTWSITRGPDWKKYPDHRWDVEHNMLPLLEKEYPDTRIGFLLPDGERDGP